MAVQLADELNQKVNAELERIIEHQRLERMRDRLKSKVLDLDLAYTDHCLKRIRDRDINPDEIFHILLDKYYDIRLLRSLDCKLAYISERISFIFKIASNFIILITVMNFKCEPSEEVMVI